MIYATVNNSFDLQSPDGIVEQNMHVVLNNMHRYKI